MTVRHWVGGGPGTYSFGTGTNWVGGVAPGTSDAAVFDASQLGPYIVTGNATIDSGEVLLDQVILTGTINLTDAATGLFIGGEGSLTIAPGAVVDVSNTVVIEPGTLTVDGALYASELLVLGGTMILADNPYSANVIAGPGVLEMDDDGELVATATVAAPYQLQIGPDGSSETFAAAATQTLTMNQRQTSTPVPWSFNGNAVFALDFGAPGDTGTVLWYTPSGSTGNGATWTTVVHDGTLKAGDGNFYFITYYASSTTVDAGATLEINGFATLVTDLEGAGQVTDSGPAAPLSVYGSSVFNGTLQGSLSLVNYATSLTLTAASAYTGGTTIESGTLAVANGGALGSGPLTTFGGLLLATATVAIPNQLEMNDATTFAAAPGQTLTIGGPSAWNFAPSSNDSLAFGAPGETGVVLWQTQASSTFNGVAGPLIDINDGTLKADDSNFYYITFFGSGTTIAAGATLDINGFATSISNLVDAGTITNSSAQAATLTLYTLSSNSSAPLGISGSIGGNLTLDDDALGFTLTGSDSVETKIEQDAGFTVGTGGSVTGPIVNNGGRFAIDSSAPVTLTGYATSSGNIVSGLFGNGTLIQLGSGTTTLTGVNDILSGFTGETIIGGGILSLAKAAALGSGGLGVSDSGGELLVTATADVTNHLDVGANFTIAATSGQTLTIGDPSPWIFQNTFTLSFGASGDNGTVVWQTPSGSGGVGTVSWAVVVQNGTLQAGDSNFSDLTEPATSTIVDAGATLDLAGYSASVNNLQGAGVVTDSGAAAVLSLTGSLVDTFNGEITGAIMLEVFAGDQILGGANTYTGGTLIESGGALSLTNDGSIVGPITDGGTLTVGYGESGNVALDGAITGDGAFDQEGAGTTTLASANNTFGGGTTISAGTLELVQSTSAGTGTITFAPGADATLQIDGTTMPSNLIAGFAPGDSLDLANIPATNFVFAGPAGTMTVSYTTNNVTTSYSFPLSTMGGDDFVLGPDGHGGTRITSAPISSDFNGDGKSDILLNASNGAFVDWTMNGLQIAASQVLTYQGNPVTLPSSWSIAGIGDFSGAGPADILLSNIDGTFVDWTMNGSQITAAQMLTYRGAPVTLPSSWSVAGIGDFTDDGHDDILLHNTNGTFVDWTMTGSQISSAQVLAYQGSPVTLPASWSVAGIGDFTGDGHDDILLHNTNGSFVDWTMNGSQIAAAQMLTSGGMPVTLPLSWSVAGIGDFTGYGRDDILLHSTNGAFVDWTMNGSQIAAAQMLTSGGVPVMLDASWSVAEVGDFNNTGQTDILLHNSNGELVEWTLNRSAAITSSQTVTYQNSPETLQNSFQIAASPATGGGSGTQIVGAGETLTNPIIGGGTLDLLSGAVVNGPITFAAGSTGTLLDSDQANLPDTVMGFAEGADYLSFSGETSAGIATVLGSAQTANGNTTLSFPDGTSIVLAGVTHVDAGVFA